MCSRQKEKKGEGERRRRTAEVSQALPRVKVIYCNYTMHRQSITGACRYRSYNRDLNQLYLFSFDPTPPDTPLFLQLPAVFYAVVML